MAKIGTLSIDLGLNTARFAADVRRAQRSTRSLERRMRKSFDNMRRSAQRFSGLLAGLVSIAAVKKATDLFVRQEQAIFQLEQRLQSTGNVAGLTSTQLQRMAASLQDVTAFGDEAVIEMQSLLLTFTQIRGQTFIKAQEAILNVATAMGTDLKSAALQVGKALNDPLGQLSALSRSGIILSEAQKELIRDFVKVGDVASAQGIILKELQTEFGGAARAASKGLGGALKQLNNAFGDLLETLVRVTTDGGKGGFIKWITSVVKAIDNGLGHAKGLFTAFFAAIDKGLSFAKFSWGVFVQSLKFAWDETIAGMQILFGGFVKSIADITANIPGLGNVSKRLSGMTEALFQAAASTQTFEQRTAFAARHGERSEGA